MFDRYDEVAFVGATLGPLFAADPADASSARQVATFAALDVDAAATEWPFVAEERARKSLAAMREGAEDADSEALVWEYRRLFVGPGAMPVPPWGSVYTDRECVVFGEATLALRSWMRRNGIARQGAGKTPEDHIGLMLLLMAWIASHKPKLLEEYLRDHLLTWSSHMFEQLEGAAQHSFYRGLAQLTKESLEGIAAEMDIQVEYPRFYR